MASNNVFVPMYGSLIDWSKYFDHIYCVHFIDYKEREEEMKNELKRVGLLDCPIFSFKYTFSTPLDNVLLESPKFNYARNNSNFKRSALNLAIGHYSAMKEALGLGYKRVLFIEDDMTFLKNVSVAREILENMPLSADVIMFDKVGITGDYEKYLEDAGFRENDFYNKYFLLWSTGCYALNEKGMRHITECQEKRFNVADYYTNGFSPDTEQMVIVNDGLKRVFSKTSLAIQKPAKGDNITDHGDSKWVYNQKGLSACGTDFSLYNLE